MPRFQVNYYKNEHSLIFLIPWIAVQILKKNKTTDLSKVCGYKCKVQLMYLVNFLNSISVQ